MKARVISIHYSLTDTKGKLIDKSSQGNPLVYLEGAGNIIAGLEAEIRQLKTGDKKQITVLAKDAYGNVDSSLVMEVARSQFPADQDIKSGDKFRGGSDAHSPVFEVKSVTDTHVTIDGNHPLAGQDLIFDIEVLETREASEEELSHGHVHGPHGHHH